MSKESKNTVLKWLGIGALGPIASSTIYHYPQYQQSTEYFNGMHPAQALFAFICAGTTVVALPFVPTSVSATTSGPDVTGEINGVPFEGNIHHNTFNNLPHDVVEENAKKVYDAFDKNHIPTVEAGATLVTESPEARELLEQIFDGRTPQEVAEGLDVMQKVYKKL